MPDNTLGAGIPLRTKQIKALLSLDLKSSWERQTIKVVKININVAGGDKFCGGN